MKTIIMKALFILLVSVALFSNCKKDVASCKTYQQQKIRENPIDPNTIDVPEFRALLAQYPYLRPYEFTDTDYSSIMKCNVFCKGLPVLTDQFVIAKNKTTNQVTVMDTLRSYDLPVSTEPGISYTDAIKEAKKIANFDHTCIFYSLGIYNSGMYGSYHPANYVLVWKIEGKNKYPMVMLDAHTKQLYRVYNNGLVD